MRIRKPAFLIVMLLLTPILVAAQDRKSGSDESGQYVVSAKSGIVSIISGDVTLKRGTDKWETLIEGDELKAGDVVKTGAFGRTEILLNPGTYLRLNENTEFAFPDLTSFKLKLSLLSGSAILEASVIDVAIKFTTPQHLFTIATNGLYRFNAEPEGKSEMMVYKGKVRVAGVDVKDGKKVIVGNDAPAVQAFDKKALDTFDTWSKDRAKTIIAANKKLSDRRMKSSLTRGLYSNLWVYDPFLRGYTFLPGWSGFSSPYGGTYSNCNPYWYYNNGYNGSYRGGNNGNNGNGNWGNGSGSGASGGTTRGGVGGGGGGTGGASSGVSRRPTHDIGGGRGTVGGASTRKGSPDGN